MTLKYEPLAQILKRRYGYDIQPNTQNRWVNGKLKDGRKLKHIRLGGRILCTEDDVISFV